MTVRPGLALAALALASVLAGGCGGSERLSRDEYLARLTELRARVDAAEREIRATIGPDTAVAEIGQALARFAQVHEQVAEKLAALEPPGELREVNELAVQGHEQFAADLIDIERELDSVNGRDAAFGLVERRLASAPGARQLEAALERFRKLGIRLETEGDGA